MGAEEHTSDDLLQQHERHRQDSNAFSTWPRPSEQEMFACLNYTDSGDESDCPCEPCSYPKPMNNDWC